MQIRKLSVQLEYFNARPTAFVAPKTKKQEKQFKKSLGITTGKLKKIPVPVIPGLPVKVSVDAKGRVKVAYPTQGLEQIIAPLPIKEITRNIDFSLEESEQRDSLAFEYYRAAVDAVRDLDDGNSFFRINSTSGDINPENYARTQILEDLETYFDRLVNRYSDFSNGEVSALDFVHAISVWRNYKGEDWARDNMKLTGTDFTRPIRVSMTKQGLQAKPIPRHAVKRKKGKKK